MEWFAWALISTVFLAIVPIFSKKVLLHEHATEFLTAAYILFGVFSLPLLTKANFSMPIETWILLYLKGFMMAFALILFNKALRHMELSSIEPLKNLSVVFLIVFAYFILGEKLDMMHGLGTLLVILGSFKLEKAAQGFEYNVAKNKYLLFIILALIIGAFASILDKIIIPYTNVETLVVIPNIVIALHLILIQFVKYKGFADLKHAFRIGGIYIVLVAFFKIAAEFTYMQAVAIPTAFISLIMVLRRSSVLLTTFIGGELFHDHNLKHKMIAAVIMLIGVYLILA